jgi:hypothetical protein
MGAALTLDASAASTADTRGGRNEDAHLGGRDAGRAGRDAEWVRPDADGLGDSDVDGFGNRCGRDVRGHDVRRGRGRDADEAQDARVGHDAEAWLDREAARDARTRNRGARDPDGHDHDAD